MEKIGMVGVGAMGSALLERLRKANIAVTAFDVAPSAITVARGLGAVIAPSAAAVAQESTLIDVVVRTDQEVLDCTTAEGGILGGARPGTLVLLHSTIRPEMTKKVYEAARAKNVYVMDACMTAVPHVVREGGLTFLVGGPAELFERAKPHLLAMAKDAIHMGPLGTGNVAKLIKNLVTAAEGLIVYEALRIGKAGGINYRDALEMMQRTKSESVLNRWQERFDLSADELGFRTGANLYDKDVPLASEVGKSLAVDIPVTQELAALGLRLVRAKKRSS
jgi:3-hydroxyisobutyrate dehydrogenase-like beta-hydroxyacid dehydrogenase